MRRGRQVVFLAGLRGARVPSRPEGRLRSTPYVQGAAQTSCSEKLPLQDAPSRREHKDLWSGQTICPSAFLSLFVALGTFILHKTSHGNEKRVHLQIISHLERPRELQSLFPVTSILQTDARNYTPRSEFCLITQSQTGIDFPHRNTDVPVERASPSRPYLGASGREPKLRAGLSAHACKWGVWEEKAGPLTLHQRASLRVGPRRGSPRAAISMSHCSVKLSKILRAWIIAKEQW